MPLQSLLRKKVCPQGGLTKGPDRRKRLWPDGGKTAVDFNPPLVSRRGYAPKNHGFFVL